MAPNRPKSEKRQDDERASEGDGGDVAVDLGGHGAWSVEQGARSKVPGARSQEHGLWSMGAGIWAWET